MLGGLEKTLLVVLLVVLMMGMGATLRLADFGNIARHPKAALVGLLSQFGWMPAIAYGLARMLELPPALALGLMLVGSTPGGTTSNLFTYLARGDVALSISMTVVSTIVAIVAMPLLLWVYARPIGALPIDIPYDNILMTLVLVLVPVVLGMVIRARRPALAGVVERVGAISGMAVLLLLVVSSLLRNTAYFAQVPARGYVAAFLLGALGLGLGYLGAAATRLPPTQRRAVSFETGLQNSPLAFAIILGSFPPAQHEVLLRLPLLYALFVLITCTVLVLFFRRCPVE